MNWYKIYKLAFPVIDRYEKPSYFDIGHGDIKKVPGNIVLWFIDSDWKLNKITEDILRQKTNKNRPTDEQFPYSSHHDWDATNQPGILAIGRYDPNRKEASYRLGTSLFGIELFREREVRKRTEEILDREFNNPTIYAY